MKRIFFKKLNAQSKSLFKSKICKPFSKKDEIENFKETNLKGYINYIRKHSHKFAKVDPLDLKVANRGHQFNADFWELSQIEKLDEFPVDTSYTFTESILSQGTIMDLENHLHSNYLSNVN